MLISRMLVSGKPSFSLSILTFFSAQMRPVSLSRALHSRAPQSLRLGCACREQPARCIHAQLACLHAWLAGFDLHTPKVGHQGGGAV